jgi:serine/threonine-protein kinase HipA
LGESQKKVGYLSLHKQGNRSWSSFIYDGDWLSWDKAFAISPDLPLGRDFQNHRATSAEDSIFHLAIQDTEPDGWARRVIKRDYMKQKKKAQTSDKSLPVTLTELDYLLWVDDVSRIGALRFRNTNGPYLRETLPGFGGAPPFIELASILNATQAVERSKETEADLIYLRGKGTSLGGMRPKCTIMDEKNELCIGKFPSVKDERSVTKGEVLCLKLAALAGIDAAEARIVHVVDIPVAVVKRFDRVPEGRIPYLSAASLMQINPRVDNTYTDLAATIRKYSPRAERDLEELWRRIIFNMLVTNVDDHLRNQGFLYSQHNQWRLAPAFDINPFPERERELKTWISEDSGPEMSIQEALKVCGYFNLNEEKAKKILGEVVTAVGQWKKVASSQDVQMTADELDDYELAFEHETLKEAKVVLSR